jgi:hypothetical protein
LVELEYAVDGMNPGSGLRCALLRGALVAIAGLPFAIPSGVFAVALLGSIAFGTVVLGLLEAAFEKRAIRGVLVHGVFFVACFALALGSFLEAAYAEGVARAQSMAGGFEGVRHFIADATKPVEDIGYLSIAINVCFLSGGAVSLWAPLAAGQSRLQRPRDSAFYGVAVLEGLLGFVLVGIVCGILTMVIFGEWSALILFYAIPIAGLGAAPAGFVLPALYILADGLDRRLPSRDSPTPV